MKIIVAPDKFKGSLSSFQACKSITEGIKDVLPGAALLQFPMADGGDGFDEVLGFYLKTKSITCSSFDPLMRPIQATYQWQEQSKTAIISVAAASGLWLLKKEERNPLAATTYGTGLLIKHAVENGATNILLGLGGSATNDAGIGILSALGFKLLNEHGEELKPTGANLSAIKKIEKPVSLPQIQFTIACDVQNELYGTSGAAYVYAQQKGANEKEVKVLDDGLRNIASLFNKLTDKSIQDVKGTGAAGGIAASLLSYFDCIMESGAGIIIKASGIEKHLIDADLLITGEGKLDAQSVFGKVIFELTNVARSLKIPVIALCGKVEINDEVMSRYGLKSTYQIISDVINEHNAVSNAADLLRKLAANSVTSFIQNN